MKVNFSIVNSLKDLFYTNIKPYKNYLKMITILKDILNFIAHIIFYENLNDNKFNFDEHYEVTEFFN